MNLRSIFSILVVESWGEDVFAHDFEDAVFETNRLNVEVFDSKIS